MGGGYLYSFGAVTLGSPPHLKSHLSAKTLVLGMSPLKRQTLDRPGRNSVATIGSSLTSLTNGAKYPVLNGHIRGQNGAEVHSGSTIVPWALHTCA